MQNNQLLTKDHFELENNYIDCQELGIIICVVKSSEESLAIEQRKLIPERLAAKGPPNICCNLIDQH
jgi:hypothetical protein